MDTGSSAVSDRPPVSQALLQPEDDLFFNSKESLDGAGLESLEDILNNPDNVDWVSCIMRLATWSRLTHSRT